MTTRFEMAPALHVAQWINTPAPISLEALRGRVVVLHAFQMLCPGCVAHGLPQTGRIREAFAEHEVAVIGLHTVFEHHAVMTAEALQVFVHEYRLEFPIGIDQPSAHSAVPLTMQAYSLRGTPRVQGGLRATKGWPNVRLSCRKRGWCKWVTAKATSCC